MDNTIKKLEKVPTTAISDVLKGMKNLDPTIKPLKESYKISGRAYTVQLPVGDNLMLLRSLKEAKKGDRSEEHTSELQSRGHLVCRLLLEKKNNKTSTDH